MANFFNKFFSPKESDEKENKEETFSSKEDIFEEDVEEKEKERELSIEEQQKANFSEFKPKMNRKIKQVTAVMMALLLLLVGYLVHFQIFKAPDLKADANNRRNAEAREKVIRGSIKDRNGAILNDNKLENDKLIRVYNGGIYYGNILGYVSENYSITGVEKELDSELSKDYSVAEVINKDLMAKIFNTNKTEEKKKGNSISVTLDDELQRYAYEAMKDEETGTYRKGSVVAINPKTGEILAMVSLPSFDPNNLTDVMQRSQNDKEYAKTAPLINRATQALYAPGSTFKIVTLTSALENITGIEDKSFNDKGKITFDDGKTLSNFGGESYGNVSLKEAFQYSLNTVFGTLGMELTNAQMKTTAEEFGFNKELKARGLNVEASVYPTMSKEEQGLRALSGIGQGKVLATPVQMAQVAAIIANDGVINKPQIIKNIISSDGKVTYALKAEETGKIASDIAKTVKKYMRNNVENSDGGSYSRLQAIKGAGKTGTAQYTEDGKEKVYTWFTGFAPYDNPEIAIAVVVEDNEETDENIGGRIALPIANDIMKKYLGKE